MLKKILKKIKSLISPSSPTKSSQYLKLIENILEDKKLSSIEKQNTIKKILKLLTNQIQIKYNETVLFQGKPEHNWKVFDFKKTLPFCFTNYPDACTPTTFELNTTPCFALVWRSDRILRSFKTIGTQKFDFNKQDNPENVF